MMYNWIVIGQVMQVGNTFAQIFAIKGAFYEMAKLITESEDQEEYYVKKDVPPELETDEGNVKLDSVKFEYPTKRTVPVLKNVSITVDNN